MEKRKRVDCAGRGEQREEREENNAHGVLLEGDLDIVGEDGEEVYDAEEGWGGRAEGSAARQEMDGGKRAIRTAEPGEEGGPGVAPGEGAGDILDGEEGDEGGLEAKPGCAGDGVECGDGLEDGDESGEGDEGGDGEVDEEGGGGGGGVLEEGEEVAFPGGADVGVEVEVVVVRGVVVEGGVAGGREHAERDRCRHQTSAPANTRANTSANTSAAQQNSPQKK